MEYHDLLPEVVIVNICANFFGYLSTVFPWYSVALIRGYRAALLSWYRVALGAGVGLAHLLGC